MSNFSARNRKNGTEVVEVISFEDYDGDIRTIEAYSRSFSASQLSKIAVTGVSLLKNQKEHIGITREILHKQDEHIVLTKEGFNSITQGYCFQDRKNG